MRKKIITLAMTLLSVGALLGFMLTNGSGAGAATTSSPSSFAVSEFLPLAALPTQPPVVGFSRFTQTGGSVAVHGNYAGLQPGRSYFTVIYGNKTCDPAQAFPVGYFTANSRGDASLSMTLPIAAPASVAGTMSMSVRHSDDDPSNPDQDHDGKTGPSDVVAVAGQPTIGLVECNPYPAVWTN